MSYLNISVCKPARQIPAVSILVLMDVVLKHKRTGGYVAVAWFVSILVLMDVVLKHVCARFAARYRSNVSILVLMDVVLKHSGRAAGILDEHEFQSLF